MVVKARLTSVVSAWGLVGAAIAAASVVGGANLLEGVGGDGVGSALGTGAADQLPMRVPEADLSPDTAMAAFTGLKRFPLARVPPAAMCMLVGLA